MKATLIPALLSAILAGLLPAPSRAESMIVQWEQNNGPSGPAAVAVDDAGNVIVTGTSPNPVRNVDYHTAKFAAANGTLLWETRYNGTGDRNDFAKSLAVDSAGNAIVTGNSRGIGSPNDYYTAKYAAADGALVWERRYNGPHNGEDTAYAVAVDSADNVIVTGIAAYPQGGGAIYTAKYAATNGAVLWEREYDGGGGLALAVDSGGNAIVAGTYWDEISGSSYYTAKYAGGNGALLWERRYNGSSGYAYLRDLALDNQGNAIVTGSDNNRFYTAKYAAGNGALLWERRAEPDSFGHYAEYVEVDHEGNAIVTGSSELADGNIDFYTVKYAAGNGALLWESRYNGPANGRDGPNALAVDSEGNAIVTGESVGTTGSRDSYTAKYAAADGALLWEKRYNGTSNSDDSGRAVAVDSAGGIIVAGWTNTVRYVPEDLDLDDDGLLDSWETGHFGATAGQSALDDADGDGAVELLELAFGTDPKSPASVPAPAVVVEGGYLTTTITKQPCVRYLVEIAATLESGFSAVSTTVLTDTASTLKVRDNVLIGTQPARFLRVRVTAPP